MDSAERVAAIDVGSNAVRLVVARIFPEAGQDLVQREASYRIPLRLGEGLFGGKARGQRIQRQVAFDLREEAFTQSRCAAKGFAESFDIDDADAHPDDHPRLTRP